MSDMFPNQDGFQELPDDLAALDEAVGDVLREEARDQLDTALVDRVVRSSAQGLPGRTLPLEPAGNVFFASARLRAAAALLLVTGLALAAWFALNAQRGPVESPSPLMAIEFQDQLGVASAEEAMLVAILDGDGAWLDQDSFDRPAAIDAEPVLRTRGTNVDDLAEEINQILGTTS